MTAILMVLSSACAHRRPPAPEVEQARLQQRQDAFLAALSARDLEQTVAHFADDAVLHVANMPPLRGRNAIRDFYGNVFRFMTASQATPERIEVSSTADMAWSMGSVANTFRGEQGAVEYAGKYLLVWEKRERDWSIVVYSVSTNRPD